MELLEILNWRYSTKRMNGTSVPEEKVNRILEAIRLTASSIGLQPYEVLCISNPELRAKLVPIANNQPQIAECSHLLVFAGWENVTTEQIEAYFQNMAETRGIPLASLDAFKARILGIAQRPQEVNFNWNARQVYIALGTALIAAAAEKVDATPMEGFNAELLDQELGLKERGLRSLVILPLGYRDETSDPIVKLKKVRRPLAKLVNRIN